MSRLARQLQPDTNTSDDRRDGPMFWEARSESDPSRWITVDAEGEWRADKVTTTLLADYVPSPFGLGLESEPPESIELTWGCYYRPKSRRDHLALRYQAARLMPRPLKYGGFPPPLPPIPPGCVVTAEDEEQYGVEEDNHLRAQRAWLRRRRIALKEAGAVASPAANVAGSPSTPSGC
jgi:hypothetical protein